MFRKGQGLHTLDQHSKNILDYAPFYNSHPFISDMSHHLQKYESSFPNDIYVKQSQLCNSRNPIRFGFELLLLEDAKK